MSLVSIISMLHKKKKIIIIINKIKKSLLLQLILITREIFILEMPHKLSFEIILKICDAAFYVQYLIKYH